VKEPKGAPRAAGGIRRPSPETLLGIGVFAIAMALRLPVLGWGLPYLYHPDEPTLLERSLFLPKNGFDPVHYQVPGHVTIYLQFLVAGVYFVAGRLGGAFRDPEDFAVHYFENPSGLVAAARLFEMLLSAAAAVLVYRLSRRWFGRLPSLVAAGAFAVHPRILEEGTVIRTDTAMLVILLLSLGVCQRILEAPRPALYAAQGLLLGAAFSAKYVACFALFPFLAAHAAASGRARDFFSRKLLLAAALAPVGILLTGPYLLFHAGETLEGIRAMQARVSGGDAGMFDPHPLGGWGWFLWDLWDLAGPFVVAAFLAAVPWAIARKEHRPRLGVLAALPLALYVIGIGPNPIHVPRFLVPALPGLLLTLAFFLDLLWRGGERRRWLRWACCFGGAATLAVTGWGGLRALRERTLPDTRTSARDWIRRHVPAQDPIVLYNYRDCPQIESRGQYQRRRYAPTAVHALQKEFARKKSAAAGILERIPPSDYELLYVEDSEHPGGASAAAEALGVRWVVLPFPAFPPESAPCSEQGRRLLKAFETRLELAASFLPEAGRSFGTGVRIYRLR
jgi:hypothetical protein